MALRCYLMIVILQLTAARRCHHEIKVDQKSLAPRPDGEVTLVCKISNVFIKDISVIRWFIHETQSPLYTFSKDPDFEKIERPHGDIVINATTYPTQEGTVSELLFRTHVSDMNVYRCDVTTINGHICRDKVLINFDEPTINLTYYVVDFYRLVDSVYPKLINITCRGGATYGAPHYEILYDHNPDIWNYIVDKDFEEQDMNHYYTSKFSIKIWIPDAKPITCVVSDKRGSYSVDQNIKLTVAAADTEYMLLVIAIFLSTMALAVLIGVQMVKMKRENGRLKRELSQQSEPFANVTQGNDEKVSSSTSLIRSNAPQDMSGNLGDNNLRRRENARLTLEDARHMSAEDLLHLAERVSRLEYNLQSLDAENYRYMSSVSRQIPDNQNDSMNSGNHMVEQL